MLSSGAGPVELITGRSDPVNLLPVALHAVRELVLPTVKLVPALPEPTRQAAHIKIIVAIV